ncbi:MAG: DNA primase [Verrucomicrobia bacterium]|nr:MAG: DNA primase [Verrucomicrobiota bacterium]
MAGLFSESTLERIRAASDIVEVIGSYLPLKRAGANFVTLCPFHKERTPSFNVNPHRQIFHCFGCHKGGDVFGFVREYEGLDFPAAVKRLAERARIPLEFEQTDGERQSRHLKDMLLQAHEQIAQRWQNALANEASGQIARDYLAKRGVSGEAIKFFRIGYAPDLWDDTVNWAKSKGYEPGLMEKAGLTLRKEGTDHYYDRFRGRLMFPICDEQGRVIGFSGRILTGDEKTAKYVNSPETPIFTKSKVFFGLDKSKRALLDAECAVVCEGQLDLIACYMAGVQNVVAPQGTAFTSEHARILKRYVEEVVLCFDSDDAGQNAAVRALDTLLASGLAVRVAVVPEPHDPDSYIKEFGGAAFKQLIEQAEGFFDYYLNRLCDTNDVAGDKGRSVVVQAMAEAVHKTGNSVLVDKHAQRTALRLGVSPDAVRAEFRKLARTRPTAASEAPKTNDVTTPAADIETLPVAERWLLRIMLGSDELVPWIVERLEFDWIQSTAARRIIEARIAAFQADLWADIPAFLDALPDEETRSLVTQAVANQRKIEAPAKLLQGDPQRGDKRGILEQLRDDFISRQLAALKQRANQPNLAEQELLSLLKQQQDLRAMKGKPL